MKLPLPMLAALLLMCMLLPCCKQEKGCTDLQANNYNPNATGEPDWRDCSYGSISFYCTAIDTVHIATTDTNGNAAIDTAKIKSISIMFDQEKTGELKYVGEITAKTNGSPICYLPGMKTISMDGIERRTYTWSANLILDNGETIYDVKHGKLEPKKDCQTLLVYP